MAGTCAADVGGGSAGAELLEPIPLGGGGLRGGEDPGIVVSRGDALAAAAGADEFGDLGGGSFEQEALPLVDAPASIEELTDFDLLLRVASAAGAGREIEDHAIQAHCIVVADLGRVAEGEEALPVTSLRRSSPERLGMGRGFGEAAVVILQEAG
jgi:hypothetical protein